MKKLTVVGIMVASCFMQAMDDEKGHKKPAAAAKIVCHRVLQAESERDLSDQDAGLSRLAGLTDAVAHLTPGKYSFRPHGSSIKFIGLGTEGKFVVRSVVAENGNELWNSAWSPKEFGQYGRFAKIVQAKKRIKKKKQGNAPGNAPMEASLILPANSGAPTPVLPGFLALHNEFNALDRQADALDVALEELSLPVSSSSSSSLLSAALLSSLSSESKMQPVPLSRDPRGDGDSPVMVSVPLGSSPSSPSSLSSLEPVELSSSSASSMSVSSLPLSAQEAQFEALKAEDDRLSARVEAFCSSVSALQSSSSSSSSSSAAPTGSSSSSSWFGGWFGK